MYHLRVKSKSISAITFALFIIFPVIYNDPVSEQATYSKEAILTLTYESEAKLVLILEILWINLTEEELEIGDIANSFPTERPGLEEISIEDSKGEMLNPSISEENGKKVIRYFHENVCLAPSEKYTITMRLVYGVFSSKNQGTNWKILTEAINLENVPIDTKIVYKFPPTFFIVSFSPNSGINSESEIIWNIKAGESINIEIDFLPFRGRIDLPSQPKIDIKQFLIFIQIEDITSVALKEDHTSSTRYKTEFVSVLEFPKIVYGEPIDPSGVFVFYEFDSISIARVWDVSNPSDPSTLTGDPYVEIFDEDELFAEVGRYLIDKDKKTIIVHPRHVRESGESFISQFKMEIDGGIRTKMFNSFLFYRKELIMELSFDQSEKTQFSPCSVYSEDFDKIFIRCSLPEPATIVRVIPEPEALSKRNVDWLLDTVSLEKRTKLIIQYEHDTLRGLFWRCAVVIALYSIVIVAVPVFLMTNKNKKKPLLPPGITIFGFFVLYLTLVISFMIDNNLWQSLLCFGKFFILVPIIQFFVLLVILMKIR